MRSPAPAGEAAERLGLLAAVAHAQEELSAGAGADAQAGGGSAETPDSGCGFEMGFLLERMPLDTFCAVRAAAARPLGLSLLSKIMQSNRLLAEDSPA